jgi:RNA polymerase sigma-70 factor (ECF subfamily)
MTVLEYNESVDLYANGLFRFALKLTLNEENARDLVQDAFEKLWIKVHLVECSKSKSYLFSIIHNAIIDQSRRDKHRKSYENSQELQIVQFENFDLKQHLNNALQKLPDIQKCVVLLRDYEGYSYLEIGEITGLSEQQVKVYIFRARKYLREYIGQMEVLI